MLFKNYKSIQKIQTEGLHFYNRAIRIQDGKHVFLKSVSNKKLKEKKALEKEFEISKLVSESWGIKALAFEEEDENTTIVFEEFQGIGLQKYILNNVVDIVSFIKIGINISSCVSQMHEAGFIHKDLKTSNILINPSTLEIKLIDFSLAINSEFDNFQSAIMPERIEGSLQYMSPEQTGRMNRMVDNRSDLYSLGVILYEILTGSLPFLVTDPLELVYCHLAKIPIEPIIVRPDTPKILSKIILKLLSKVAEDRYQTAYGLKYDLELSLNLLNENKNFSEFPLGENDISGNFPIIQKLYGREKEINILLKSFNNILKTGTSKLVAISGYSGIGKTTLVNELQKPILRESGFFIFGKSDQFKFEIPYYGLVDAFKKLITQILFEPENKINDWKEKITKALGINGKIMVNLIPKLELIIGAQEALPIVPPHEEKIRFESVLEKFINVFADVKYPLTIFLDDLQWTDSASLNLINRIISNSENKYILIVVAYRDNEVNESHPLRLMLSELKHNENSIQEITLEAINIETVKQIIEESFNCRSILASELAELVYKKTNGNPFFVLQFLKKLYKDNGIYFDKNSLSWSWNIKSLEDNAYTDNVLDLMTENIKQQSLPIQNILKVAACLGVQFSKKTLSLVSETNESELENLLRPPVKDGLLFYRKEQYFFAHDKIQQASYALLTENERQKIHCIIGNHLLKNTSKKNLEENIFLIVNHFSYSPKCIVDNSQINISNLFLQAGKKARSASAYGSAKIYLENGIGLLPKKSWQIEHELTFQLYLDLSACEYLLGNFEEAENLFKKILSNLTSPVEKAGVYNVQLELYHVLGKFEEAATIGLHALEILGLPFPENDTDQAAYAELLQVQSQLKEVAINDLLDKPLMKDLVYKSAMQILMNLYAPFYNSRPHLLGLLTFRMTNYSLQFGNTASTPYAYVYYGILLGTGMGDYQQGKKFGEMALALNEKLGNKESFCKVFQTYGTLVHPWTNPMESCLPFLKNSYTSGLASGDLIFSGFSLGVSTYIRIIAGHDLRIIFEEGEKFFNFFKRSKDQMMFNAHKIFIQHCLNLMGETKSFDSLDTQLFDEEIALAEMEEKHFAYSFYWYYLVKMQVLYHSGKFSEALIVANKIKDSISLVHFAQISVPEFGFYYSLILSALFDQTNMENRLVYVDAIKAEQEKLKKWSDNSPENFLHKFLLVSAELKRIENDGQDVVMSLYEDSIKSAHQNKFIQNEALAYELASNFYRNKGLSIIAKSYLIEARDSYLRWGAAGKVKYLESNFPELMDNKLSLNSPSTVGFLNQHLDLHSIIKASQAISSPPTFVDLSESLMKVVMEQAGATKGALLLKKDGKFIIVAEAIQEKDELIVETISAFKSFTPNFIPEKIIQFVKRTKENLIIGDFSNNEILDYRTSNNEKVPISMACIQIVKHGNLIGILYLENNLFKGAFTSEKIEVIELLAAKVAMSIENVLYLEELTKNELSLRMTLRQIPGIIWTTDKLFNFNSIQGTMLKKLNIDSEALIGTSINDFFENKNHSNFHISAHEKAILGESIKYEYESNGYVFECYLEAMKNANNDITGCIGLSIDITEKVKYIKDIETNNKNLKDIAWIQSHIVRAPLSRIMGLIELLKNNNIDPKEVNVKEVFGFIIDSANELDALLRQIVDKTNKVNQ